MSNILIHRQDKLKSQIDKGKFELNMKVKQLKENELLEKDLQDTRALNENYQKEIISCEN